jgi:ABC-2 type transport system ATP-binding protein
MAVQKEAGVSGGGEPGRAAPVATVPAVAAPAGAPEPLLRLQDVTVRFGRTLALDRASLDIFPGDTVAVVGPDGAGKSTLLRVMAGLTGPTSGTIGSKLSRAGLGYAGSTFDLYSDLTVLENLSFFGRVRGMGEEKLLGRIEAMLSLTGLKDARDRLAGRLSGGMQKGLALGCALVHQPALLLLDEPTVGVDPVSRQKLWDIITEATDAGTALVFTSTYLEEANHAARLGAMASGRLIETTVDRVMAERAGWSAWVLPMAADEADADAGRPGVGWGGASRTEVRARLAAGQSDPHVYLRPEGLTALAPDEGGARRLLAATVGEVIAGSELARSDLTFEDAFVLLESREKQGAAAP